LTRIFIIIIFISLLVSCSSPKQKFKIDNTISSVIDSIFNNAYPFFAFSKNSGCLVHVKNTFDYERFGQNSRDLVYFLKADSNKATGGYVKSMFECFLNKDTIDLTVILSYESNVAFKISIFDDKVNSRLRLIAAEKIYSKTEKKNDLQNDLILNSESTFLTLTEKPKFKPGSTLKGKMEVKFEPFYQVDISGRLSKIAPQFDIIFDTEVR
jgi:hypothetical protein